MGATFRFDRSRAARTLRSRWIAGFSALMLAIGSAAAIAAPPAASGSANPSAAPATSAAPSASASAAPTASASAAPSAGGSELPPGHPPTGEMPPGHPPTGSGGRGDPHGGMRGQVFDAPEDATEDDATLPAGTLIVKLEDADGRPVPERGFSLAILHSSVAKGESRERREGETDATGSARFDGLPTGSGISYRVTVSEGDAVFGSEPFGLGDRMGKRTTVHLYRVTNRIEEAMVGTQGIVYLALREDVIVVEHLFAVFNLGRTAWVPNDVTIDLPEGYKAFNRPDSMDGVGVDEVKGKGQLRGTFGPGRHEVSYRFNVPLEQRSKQTVRITLPPRVAQMRVMVESSKSMGVEVQEFPSARKTKNRDGKNLLVTEKMLPREEGQQTIEITLTGLPTPGPGRYIAALGALILGGVGVYLRTKKRDRVDEALVQEWREAREALLAEIVALEKAFRQREIGPKTYARTREALLDALERTVSRIERATKEGRRNDRGGGRRRPNADVAEA